MPNGSASIPAQYSVGLSLLLVFDLLKAHAHHKDRYTYCYGPNQPHQLELKWNDINAYLQNILIVQFYLLHE